MTIGFGLASTLLLLGFVVLVFVLFAAAAKDAGYKLNLKGSSGKGKKKNVGRVVAAGYVGIGIYDMAPEEGGVVIHKIK
ncbi:MAG: hypothetical protein F4206_16935 [Gammaproteobacteria bacterium]|nr:hypothetical protein [Gammaproteobacteria bacterium]MYG68394.1 hypothetical protein [Gammaproteobacteria bacterium]